MEINEENCTSFWEQEKSNEVVDCYPTISAQKTK